MPGNYYRLWLCDVIRVNLAGIHPFQFFQRIMEDLITVKNERDSAVAKPAAATYHTVRASVHFAPPGGRRCACQWPPGVGRGRG